MHALPAPPPAHIRRAAPRVAAAAIGPTVTAAASLSVSWSGLPAADGQNWVGLYVPGSPFSAWLDWVWLLPSDNGTVNLPIAPGRAAGVYELRVYHAANPTLLASSGPVFISAALPVPPLPPPLPPPPIPFLYGPRGALGPDVPLTAAEQTAFAARVTVQGRTAAAIQAACAQAHAQGIAVVYLPPGTYAMEAAVAVPAGLTILGVGSATFCTAPAADTEMFVAAGAKVRFTRLRLQGWSLAWTDANSGGVYNNSRGIEAFGKEQVRVDHCDLSGFCYGVLAEQGGSLQVDACSIHDDPVNGLGYGVAVDSGVWALIEDSSFGDCRTVLTSDDETPGFRQSRWEFVHNVVHNAQPNATYQRDAVDSHPNYRGTFVIEGNEFDYQPSHAAGMISGSGLIDGNRFADETGIGYTAIRLYYAQRNGVGGALHDVALSGNVTGAGVTQYALQATNAVNISVDGTVLPATLVSGRPSPPPLVRLTPFPAVVAKKTGLGLH